MKLLEGFFGSWYSPWEICLTRRLKFDPSNGIVPYTKVYSKTPRDLNKWLIHSNTNNNT